MKLVVDRARKTFKVVAKLDRLPCTAVYESKTSCWRVFESRPGPLELEYFVWGNVTHGYDTQRNVKKTLNGRLVTSLDTNSGRWSKMKVEIPLETRFPTKRFFLSNNHRVILVLCSYWKRPRPYFSVWKLLNEGSSYARDQSARLEKWEKVEIGSERAMGLVDLKGHRLVRATYGAEHIWFAFKNDEITEDGSGAQKCIRYSFASGSWSVVQCPEDWGESFRLFNWEPSLDIDPRRVPPRINGGT